MAGVLFDASLYIVSLRSKDPDQFLQLHAFNKSNPVWLSAVVLEELYAGSAAHARKRLERLRRNFIGVKRVLVPNLSDWVRTGEILALIGEKYGYEKIGRARLTNDALIANSAARNGVNVLTANQRDFAKIAEFCPLQWQVWPPKS